MERTIKYKVTFFSYWHCGSGQAAGADLDELVIKDKDGLPYIPGRTIKGLLRDACEELCNYGNLSENELKTVFGHFDDNPDEAIKGKAFFSNVTLNEKERNVIINNRLSSYLYQSVASTAIDNNGIAKDHSLRRIQVAVPCTLEGIISNIPESFIPALNNAMKLVKRMGLNRNQGMGRCQISIIDC